LPGIADSIVQQETRQVVAIKCVELGRLNKKLRENLYGEIQILKTLRHPHIVALHDCIESSTHINLIMEYCELGDLSLFIKKREKLSTHPATHDMARKYPSAPNSGLHEVVIRHFIKQLSSALEFLRKKNYVHRDVKPQNLLLLPAEAMRNQRGLPVMEASTNSLIPVAGLASLPMLKLADFGFARVLPSTSLADTLCGSPLYMAPEILRYERYDAKADLWSVGTVLYEMATGRPPFRARNHVELLRKIEGAEDVIKFPREVTITADLKALIRALLKRNPVERLSFETFFNHTVIVSEIPGLVEDDIPKVAKKEVQPEPRSSLPSSPRIATLRQEGMESSGENRTSHARASSRSPTRATGPRRSEEAIRPENSPRVEREGLGIRRPGPHHTASAPAQPRAADAAPRRNTGPKEPPVIETARPAPSSRAQTEEAAAQDVAFERDYVVVERRHVEVNALADELAANNEQGTRAGQLARRSSQHGVPASTSVPTNSNSRNAVVPQSRPGHDRRSSYDRILSSSPVAPSSAISKAIQDASLRLFGFKVPPLRGSKGHSPPMYQAFPAYPTPTTAALLGDGTTNAAGDEDGLAAQTIEELATRSDCVFGFAEVKFKQLIPIAPAEYGLGGADVEQLTSEEGELTVEAVVALAEEALVLYVKSLTLLARAMDIASVWWSNRSRGEAATGVAAAVAQSVVQRINAVVQWVRERFNEVLEKSEVVRLKLIEAQRLLPEDHPSHPLNQAMESISSSAGSAIKQVYLTPGVSAEKLMWDRALEMSRAAAIDEVTNENLQGCELSYITAIRMLEAVLDHDEDTNTKKLGSGAPPSRGGSELDMEEEEHVRKSMFDPLYTPYCQKTGLTCITVIKMITGRLGAVRKKQNMIAEAQKAQARPVTTRQRSGDVTPRSLPSSS
jgi:serine/threonine-protein kinase ULK2